MTFEAVSVVLKLIFTGIFLRFRCDYRLVQLPKSFAGSPVCCDFI